MSGNLDRAVRQINQVAANYERTPRDVVVADARIYTNAIRSSINAVTSGGRLRGVGKSGARVGVKYDVQGAGFGSATAIVQATGPLHLIERDNRDHDVPRTQRTRRLRTASGRLSHKREGTGVAVSGRVPMLIDGKFWRTGPWRVKGSKGKHPFDRGVRVGRVQVIDANIKSAQSAVSRALGG